MFGHVKLEQLKQLREHTFLRQLAKDPLRSNTAFDRVDADSILVILFQRSQCAAAVYVSS